MTDYHNILTIMRKIPRVGITEAITPKGLLFIEARLGDQEITFWFNSDESIKEFDLSDDGVFYPNKGSNL